MFRKILTIITVILLAIVIKGAWPEISNTFGCLFTDVCRDANNNIVDMNLNPLIVLLLIPEQLFMYFTAGQIFFSYMKAKKQAGVKKLTPWALARISFELNFVNHAVPSGGVSGLGYIAWRLNGYGATPGQVSFMYLLRYAITIIANQTQTIFAIIVLLLCNAVPGNAMWLIWVIGAMSVGIIAAIAVIIAIASSKKNVDWASKQISRFCNFIVLKLSFGKKKNVLPYQTVHKFLMDLHEDVMTARKNKKLLVKPCLWGVIYNFLEIATYEIVAISMGHPEIFPAIMVAEALGSVVGGVLPTPGGVGGYEGSMIAVMTLLGTPFQIASVTVIVTRMVVLVNTIVSGYGFYQNAISKIGKKDKEKIAAMNKESKIGD